MCVLYIAVALLHSLSEENIWWTFLNDMVCLLWYEFSWGPFLCALLCKLLCLLADFVICTLVSLEGNRENRKEDWKTYYIFAPSTYSIDIGIANFNSQEYSYQNSRFWEGFLITKDQLFGSSISVPFRSWRISEFVALMV